MLSNHLINVRVEDREMSANIRLKWCKNVDLIHVPNSIKNRCNVLKINIGSHSAGITKKENDHRKVVIFHSENKDFPVGFDTRSKMYQNCF
jgi:hypothetical protein